jgi:hypothetical protein
MPSNPSFFSCVSNKERFLAELIAASVGTRIDTLTRSFGNLMGPSWNPVAPNRTFRSVDRERPASKPLVSAACRVES